MNINLHIERLVLDGLPVQAQQGPAIQAALEGELLRLLKERGLDGLPSGAYAGLSTVPIHLAAGGQPTQWARQIAGALFAGLALNPSRPLPERRSAPSSPAPLPAADPRSAPVACQFAPPNDLNS